MPCDALATQGAEAPTGMLLTKITRYSFRKILLLDYVIREASPSYTPANDCWRLVGYMQLGHPLNPTLFGI